MKNVKTEEEFIEKRLQFKTRKYQFIRRWWERKVIIAELNKLVMIFTPSDALGSREKMMSDLRAVEILTKDKDAAEQELAIYHIIREVDQAFPLGAHIAHSDTTPAENYMAEDYELDRQAEETREHYKRERERLRKEVAEGHGL